MKTTFLVRAALAATAALCGCRETTPSDYIRTSRMAALVDFTAESEKSSAVRVELRVDGAEGTYVILHEGDRLSASAGDLSKELKQVDLGVYGATFGTGAEVELTVAFHRDEHLDARSSEGTLPAPFVIEGPVEGEVVSRSGADLVVTWTPVVDPGTVAISGPCIVEKEYEVSGEEGTFLVAKGELVDPSDEKQESCEVEVTMTFEREGAADPVLHDESRVVARQIRRVTFTSEP